MYSCQFFQIVLVLGILVIGFHAADDILLDTPCFTNLDCEQYKLPGHNVTCLDLKCICNDINTLQIPCLPNPVVASSNNIIGGICPCQQPNSECDTHKGENGMCFCKKGYVATLDKRRCIKKTLALGEKCEDDAQCMELESFAECDVKEKICTCQKNFVKHNGTCISVIGLDKSCLTNDQCQNKTANSICADRKCACALGFIINSLGNKCLQNAGYNEVCTEIVQCKNKLGPGSECYSGFCTCDSQHSLVRGTVSNNLYCAKRIEFGDYCREHNECFELNVDIQQQSMKCFMDSCVCETNFKHKDKRCVRENSAASLTLNRILLGFVVLLVVVGGNHIEKNFDL